jgi:hypothetical protein
MDYVSVWFQCEFLSFSKVMWNLRKEAEIVICAPQGGAEAGVFSTRCGPFRAGRVPRELQDTPTSYDRHFMAGRQTTATQRCALSRVLPLTVLWSLVLMLGAACLGTALTGSYVGQARFVRLANEIVWHLFPRAHPALGGWAASPPQKIPKTET